MAELGRLSRCCIRDIWPLENDFSNWLFEKDNVELLSDSLELGTIETTSREEHVGDFRVDICGQEANTEKKVVIENQFGSSNHDHLGKIITYAAGKDAQIIIWVVENARPEHAAAIEWLNRSTSDKGFFLVEVEVWKIGNSLPAPKFNVIERPNEWSKVSGTDTDASNNVKYEFWNGFFEKAVIDEVFVAEFPESKTMKANANFWKTFRSGSIDNCDLNGKVILRNGVIRQVAVDLWIHDRDLYEYLYTKKEAIESEIGSELQWKELRTNFDIMLKRPVVENESPESMYSWIRENIVILRNALKKQYLAR